MDGRGWRGLAAVALSLLVAAPAPADRVVLVGGDVLECKVVEQNDTTVVIEHPVLGRLEIPVEAGGVQIDLIPLPGELVPPVFQCPTGDDDDDDDDDGDDDDDEDEGCFDDDEDDEEDD